VAFAALFAVLAVFPLAAQAAGPATVSSGDGLALSLSSTGAVTSLKIGGREVAGGAAPLFSVRKVGGTPNLLPNPSLEADADGNHKPDHWRLNSGTVRPRWVSDQAHTGTRSIRFHSPSTGTSTTLQTTIAVRPDTYYTAGSWIRSQHVKPAAATAEPATGPSSVRLKIQQFDGSTRVDTDQAYGYTDTVGWHRKFIGFKTQPNVTSVRVLAQIVHGSGTVWFDDLQVNELFKPT
jgi:hypothetical protein